MKSTTSDNSQLEHGISLLTAGDVSGAAEVFGGILRNAPASADARDGLRKCCTTQHTGSRVSIANEVWRTLKTCGSFLDGAVPGWIYTLLFDGNFCDPELRRTKLKPTQPGPVRFEPDRGPSAFELLRQLEEISDTASLGRTLREITERACPAIQADSFFAEDLPDKNVELNLRSEAASNFVILGAGCTGLTLANSLKLSLGDQTDVVVVENRVQARHIKKPYSRDWLTLISTASLSALIDPKVIRIMEKAGQPGYIGVPINVLETLLLLSSKILGVRFLFCDDFEVPPADRFPLSLVFDATGGRLRPSVLHDDVRTAAGRTLTVKKLKQYCDGYVQFGIPRNTTQRTLQIETRSAGGFIGPAVRGQPLRSAMMKLTNLPLALLTPLKDWVRGRNADRKFYIWPGMLRPEINRLLILINLTRQEYESASSAVLTSCRPDQWLQQDRLVSAADPRLTQFLRFVAERSKPEDDIRVQPPFVFEPYMCPYPDEPEQLNGHVVIRVGDSVYNGNPKAGNGLARHLLHVASVHDAVLMALATAGQPDKDAGGWSS